MSSGRAMRDSRLLAAADLAATAVFALEGALASAGGVLRDVLIGDVPPLSVRAQRFVLVAVLAGVIAIVFHAVVDDISAWLLTGSTPLGWHCSASPARQS